VLLQIKELLRHSTELIDKVINVSDEFAASILRVFQDLKQLSKVKEPPLLSVPDYEYL